MNRHFLGLLVAFTTFVIGSLAAPIGFKQLATGHGVPGNQQFPCSFSVFESSDSGKLTYWQCFSDSEQAAKKEFDWNVSNYRPVLVDGRRAVVSYSIEGIMAYCVFRLDGSYRRDICSSDLNTVLAFEDQRLLNKLF